jgi:hypothetical protein
MCHHGSCEILPDMIFILGGLVYEKPVQEKIVVEKFAQMTICSRETRAGNIR